MKKLADLFVVLAAVCVVFAIVGAVGSDIWLASTQWLLIGAVLSIWAVYIKIRD